MYPLLPCSYSPPLCTVPLTVSLMDYRSRRSNNQPLNLSKASNSLLFTTQATRYYRQTAPPPEPIGKRASSREHGTTSAAEILLTRKSKERSGVSEMNMKLLECGSGVHGLVVSDHLVEVPFVP